MNNKNLKQYNNIFSIVYEVLKKNNLLDKIPENLRNIFENYKSDTLEEVNQQDAFDIIQAILNCYISENVEDRNAWLQSVENDKMQLQLENKEKKEFESKIEKEIVQWFKISIPSLEKTKVKHEFKTLSDEDPDKYYRPPYPRNWYWDENEDVLKFLSINHKERANEFGRRTESFSPEIMAKYTNVALSFFGYRCAFSGEGFTIFKNSTSNDVKTNLSVEHALALSQGGDDIIGNILATSLPYNISKNEHYLLEWWPRAKNGNGEFIYSTERLLKVTYFILKTLQMREEIENGGENFIEEYKKNLFEKDSVLEYIEKIEREDPEKILSDYITDTERTIIDGKEKYLLESVDLENNPAGELTTLKNDMPHTMKAFLFDAVAILERDLKTKNEDERDEIIEVLNRMKDIVLPKIDNRTHQEILIEEEIRSFCKNKGLFLEKKDEIIINDLLCNKKYWENINDQLTDEEIRSEVNAKLEKQYKICEDSGLLEVIKINPRLLVLDEKYVQRVKFWKENRADFEELISRTDDKLDEFIDVMIVLKKNGIVFHKKRMDKSIIGDKTTKESLLYDNEKAEKIIEELKVILGEDYKKYPISKKILDMKRSKESQDRFFKNIDDFIDEKELDVLFDKNQKNDKAEIQDLINVLLYLHNEFEIELKDIKTGVDISKLLKSDNEKIQKAKAYIKEVTGVGKSSLLNIGKSLYNAKQNNYGKFVNILYSTIRDRKIELSEDDMKALKNKVNPNSPWMNKVYYKAKKGTLLKSYKAKNLSSIKSMDESIKNLSIQTNWLKDKFKNDKDIKDIDKHIENIIQISMNLADYIAVDKIKEETGKELTIEDEKCLIYFLMDQEYSDKLKISTEEIPLERNIKKEKEYRDPNVVFENAIKNLKQDSRLDVKDKDTLQLLREYY